jgi:hypothetical protein
MGRATWGSKPNADPDWAHVGSLGGLIITSEKPSYFDPIGPVYGLNPYLGSSRLVGGGGDAGLWIDGIQGYGKGVKFKQTQNGPEYDIVRSARIPYLIKSEQLKNRKKEYLDHILVGYASTKIDVPSGTQLYGWSSLRTGGGGNGDIRELGTFLVEDLWPGAVPPLAIPNWWRRNLGQDPPADYGFLTGTYNVPREWPFREVTRIVYQSVRICVADEDSNVWYLLVGYEGGGGW